MLQSFDSTLHAQTNSVTSILADEHSLSLHSLSIIIKASLDTDQDALKRILEYETDAWNHDELFSLVRDYLETSIQTLDFCKSIEDCLTHATSSVSFLQTAIAQYDEDANHLNTLKQFSKFKASDKPFSNEFLTSFRSVYGKQVLLLNKIRIHMVKVVKKLDSVKTWRRLSNVAFVTTFSTVLICSVVAAVVAAPPLVVALAAAATLVPFGSMGKWVDSLWQKYEKELRYHKITMNVMKVQSDVFVIKDLENIKAIVDRMEIKMDGMLKSADFVIGEGVEEAVAIGVEEMKNAVKDFSRMMDDLSVQSVKSTSDIKRATTMILENLMNILE